jgi:peptide/nickel transport system ATP-binding protein
MRSAQDGALLRIENLTRHFSVRLGAYGQHKSTIHAVDQVSFEIRKGETLGLVGESGCGKSTVGLTILQLHRPTQGEVYYHGLDLTRLKDDELRPLRQKLQMIFQDPYSTLNPRMTVGTAIAEPMLAHRLCPKERAMGRVCQLMEDVGLAGRYVSRYPHEFSGGQRQRICIARALACDPEFIVCDEPISALDVSIQAQIINLLEELQEKYALTYLFIAHNLAVVKHISDRVAVMYLGRLAEVAPKREIFADPLHPYTRALLSAVPIPDPEEERNRTPKVLIGDVPSAIRPPSGCRFHPRCPIAQEQCREIAPAWREVEAEHWVACHAV